VFLWFAEHHWHLLEVLAINAFDVYEAFYFTKHDSRSSCISNRLWLCIKNSPQILLAPQLHACDTFLAAADAEFLQTCHVVACAASPQYICRFQYAQWHCKCHTLRTFSHFLSSTAKNVITNNEFKSASFRYTCTLHVTKANNKSNFTRLHLHTTNVGAIVLTVMLCIIEYCGCVCVCYMVILTFCSFACKIYEWMNEGRKEGRNESHLYLGVSNSWTYTESVLAGLFRRLDSFYLQCYFGMS